MALMETHWDMKSPKEDILMQEGGVWISAQGYCLVGNASSRSTADVTVLLVHLRAAKLVRLLCLGSNS